MEDGHVAVAEDWLMEGFMKRKSLEQVQAHEISPRRRKFLENVCSIWNINPSPSTGPVAGTTTPPPHSLQTKSANAPIHQTAADASRNPNAPKPRRPRPSTTAGTKQPSPGARNVVVRRSKRRRIVESESEDESDYLPTPESNHSKAPKYADATEVEIGYGGQRKNPQVRKAASGGVTLPSSAKFSRHGWGAIIMLKSLVVRADIKWDIDASCFMFDKLSIGDSMLPEAGQSVNGAFADRYEYTRDLTARQETDPIRLCFAWLCWYDTLKLVNTKGTTHRLSKTITKKLQKLLATAERDAPRTADTNAWEQCLEWCRFGKKIDHLCREFGAGCLFVLAPKLSADFLRYKSPAGTNRNEAYRHLRSLEIKSIISGFDRLDTDTRGLLADPLREIRAAIGGAGEMLEELAGTISTSPEEETVGGSGIGRAELGRRRQRR